LIKNELWDKMIESFEIVGYREVNDENVESESQAPVQETPVRRAPGDALLSRGSPSRKKN
jgi:hypothetical protein